MASVGGGVDRVQATGAVSPLIALLEPLGGLPPGDLVRGGRDFAPTQDIPK